MKLSQKETGLLRDLQSQEEVCVKKYDFYAEQAQDSELKALFQKIGRQEQTHYDSLGDVLKGKTPAVSHKGESAAAYHPKASYKAASRASAKKQDEFLCTDSITTEKYVSSAYDNDLFQFSSTDVRDLLNHIQSEEQNHAQMIYQYKSANSMN